MRTEKQEAVVTPAAWRPLVLSDEAKVRQARAYVEGNYPLTAAEFKRLAGEADLYSLFCIKQMDYGPENIRGGNDLAQPFGRLMAVREVGRRTGDKISRISNLTLKAIQADVLDNVRLRHENTDVLLSTYVDQMLSKAIEGFSPANESLEDSWWDTAVYAIISLIVMAGKWGK